MRHLRFQTIFLSPITFYHLASALVNIIAARQQCENEWCLPSLPWNPIDALMGAGAAAVGDLINGFVTPQSPIGTNEKDSDARPWTNRDREPDVNPQVEDDQDQCRTSNNLPGQVSFYFAGGIHQTQRVFLITIHKGQANAQGCRATTKQIVWPVLCELTAEMIAIEELLKSMDSNLWASKLHRCSASGSGIFFWAGAFSNDQIDLIRSKISVIAAVEPNVPLQQALSTVIKDEGDRARPSLNFISTAPGKQDSGTYAYFSETRPRTPVTVYVIDAGFGTLGPEFMYTKNSWLYAEDTQKIPEPDPTGHGTCMISALLGDRYGVAKRVPMLVLAKIVLDFSSILDILRKIITHIAAWQDANQKLGGYAVIHLSTLSVPVDELSDYKLREVFTELVRDYQAVVVIPAGQNNRQMPAMDSPDGNVWLTPSTYSLDFEIITVGAVSVKNGPDYGVEFPWSHGGPAITVHAPGNGRCAVDIIRRPEGFEDVIGTSIASAYTAGLAAYFLGLPDLGPFLRRSWPEIPKAVKEFIQSKAYARNTANPAHAIWNGLDAQDAKLDWNYWIGNPKVDN